jgi:hypothetical protein
VSRREGWFTVVAVGLLVVAFVAWSCELVQALR